MRKVLIVEDDRFITAIFTMFIKDLGHELIGRAVSGIEAIEMCIKEKPDVVLMDIHLEGEIDGIQTSERLQREIGVPVIYISSDTSTDVIKRAVVSNSYGYLVKPINKQELGIAIDLAYYKYKVDQEQKAREKSYREFISDSPTPIVLVKDEKLIYLNKASLDIFKTHYIEDVMGLPISNFLNESSVQTVKEMLTQVISSDKKIKPFTAQLKTVHGEMYWVQITGSKVMFNNQQTTQLVLRDMSKEAECAKLVSNLEDSLFTSNKRAFKLNTECKLEVVNHNMLDYLNLLAEVEITLEGLITNADEVVATIKQKTRFDKSSFDVELVTCIGSRLTFSVFPRTNQHDVLTHILLIEN